MADSFEDDAHLRHYGVLGMKWGRTRTSATSTDIHRARTKVSKQKTAVKAQQNTVNAAGNKTTRNKEQVKLNKMRVSALKNPDRVTAARLTRGEKTAFVLVGLIAGPVLPVAVGAIAGTSAVSRRIERKQDLGKYDK